MLKGDDCRLALLGALRYVSPLGVEQWMVVLAFTHRISEDTYHIYLGVSIHIWYLKMDGL